MNKQHWNTVEIEGTVKNSLIEEWIDHSYELVVKGLKKSQKEILNKIQ
jgi:predicted DNA-binding protein (MmcQ/YjbR family)